MKLNRIHPIVAVLSLAFALPCHAAMPVVGRRAPALTFTDLLNAPAGTKADWKSLRGKVVVLEFWATWCAPCIAQIPHLNAMALSLAADPVQFIGVDDEDSAVVEEFLAKKKMAGWVGLDTSKKIFDAYGVKSRPTTIVIDAQGKIAAVLSPEALKQEDIALLSEGKPVKFPVEDDAGPSRDQIVKEAKAAAAAPSGDASAPKPLFEISIRPGDPKGQVTMLMRPARDGVPALYEMRNVPIAEMVEWARGHPRSRVVIHGSAADAR